MLYKTNSFPQNIRYIKCDKIYVDKHTKESLALRNLTSFPTFTLW